MNVWTTIILLAVVLILLGAVIYFTPDEDEGSGIDPDLIENFDETGVTELTWTVGQDETTVRRVEGSDEDWVVMISGLEVPASSADIEDILNDLGRARIRERLSEVDAASRTEFGLDPVAAWVLVKHGDEERKVLLGTTGLRRDTSYAQLEGEEDVLLVTDDLLKSIESVRAKDVRAKRIFDGSVYDLESATVATAEGTRIAARRDEKDSTIWTATEPFAGHVDPRAMESDLLPAILNLEAEEFVADGVADDALGDYGLAEPRYRVTLGIKGQEKPRTLLVGTDMPEKKGYVHFMEEGRPFVYGGKGVEILEQLGRESSTYRDRNLTRLGWAQLGEFAGRLDDVAFTMERDGEAWRLEKPEKMEPDQGAVEAWLQRVRELEVVEFVDGPDLAALGLTEPRGELTFWSPSPGKDEHDHGGDEEEDESDAGGDEKKKEEKEEREPLVRILIGSDVEGGEGVYVARGGQEATAFVAPAAILDLVRGGHYPFRKPEVFAVERAKFDVTKIERHSGDGDPEVLEKADGKWPGETDGPAVTRIVSTVLDLRAVRWVGPAAGREEEYGLGEPTFRLSITLASKEEGAEPDVFGIVVGGEAESGRYARAVREGTPGDGVFLIAEGNLEALRVGWKKPPEPEKPEKPEAPDEPEKPEKDEAPDEPEDGGEKEGE